jgi:autotransporter-associated beta strand protein
MIFLLAVWQVAAPVQAATVTWTAGSGADFLWSQILNWSGGVLPAASDDVIFATPLPNPGVLPNPNVITLGAGSIANSLELQNSYTLTGGDLALTAGTIRASLGSYSVINSQLLGSVGLTLSGGGAVRLANNTNTYTGVTTINNGALIINDQAALGLDSSQIVINGSQTRGFGGGTLVLEGGYLTGVNLSRDVSLQGLGPIADRNAAIHSVRSNTISGNITTGILLGTTAQNTALHSTSGRLTLSGTLNLGGTTGTTFTTFGLTNTVGIGSYEVTGTVTGTGSVQKTGAGTLIWNPLDASGFSGTIRVSSGSVRLNSGSVLGTNAGTGTSGMLDLNGDNVFFEIRSDTPTIGKNVYQRGVSPALFVDHAIGSSVINGTATFGTLAFEEGETFTFNGRNGFGMTFGAAPIQGGNGATTFTNNLSGLLTFTGAFWSNTENTANRTFTFGGNGNTLISGNLTASSAAFNHNFTKGGTGTLTISSTGSTLDGNVTITGGTLAITDWRSITNNTSAINIGNTTTTATLAIVGANPALANLTTAKVINLNGTTGGAIINANQTGANPVVINSAFTATGGAVGDAKTLTLGGSSTADNAINGAIPNNAAGGTVNLVKADLGTWVLGGNNLYTGTTTITGGTLKLRASAAASNIIASTGAVIFNANATTQTAGGTLDFVGQVSTANAESLGALTPTAGMNTIRLTPGAGGSASLTFTSLGTVNAASGTNIITAAGSTVTVTGVATSTATTLPGTGKIYINGADFARSSSGLLVTPVYGTDAGFVNAGASLTAANHNRLSSSIGAQAAVSVSSLKLDGSQSLGMTGNLTITTGGLLQTGGTGAISGTGITTGGANSLAVRVDQSVDVLNLSAPITSTTTGGLTKNGAGTLVISGANAQTGATTINEGTLRLDTGGVLSAANQNLALRQAGTLDLNGISTGTSVAAFNGSGLVTNSGASPATLTVGNNNGTGTFSGLIQDGTARVNVVKTGTGAQTWSGLSTYTGSATIGSTALVSVPVLANIGTASGIGRGDGSSDATNAASLVFNGTTGGINYTGTASISIDRLFTFDGGAAGSGGQIANASGLNAALIFNNTAPISFGPGAIVPQTLTLGGASTGDSWINLQLVDNGANPTALSKIGAGVWHLGNATNSYTGTTTITAGALGVLSGSSLPTNSPLVLGGGVLLSSGSFERNLVGIATPGNPNEITWTAGGGFSANASKLVVAIGGLATPSTLTWASGGFVPTGNLILNSATAVDEVEVRNPIDLNGAVRTIQVDDNGTTFTDFATITGAISGAAGSGLTKTGTGVLQLFGANTYEGVTAVTAGQLIVTSFGNSGNPGQATSVGTTTDANLAGNAITLGNAGTTAGIIQYIGVGETSDRMIRLNTTTGSTQIHADGSGPLILTNVLNDMAAGAKALLLRGSNTSGNMITSDLADNGGTLGVTVDGSATWILTGANSYTGTTAVNAGALGIAASDLGAGTGNLDFSNGSIFAYQTDRAVNNPVRLANNTTPAFVGDYSLDFVHPSGLTLLAAANNVGLTNNIAAGKTLTFAGATANSITAARTWTISGSGDTIINGDITTTTPFLLNITYSGSGSLTLGGGGSNWNSGTLTLNNGTLKIGATEVIPHGVAATTATTAAVSASTTITVNSTAGLVVGQRITGTGVTAGATVASIIDGTTFTASANQTIASGVTLSFDLKGNVVMGPAAGFTSVLDLNGNTETINGLTGTAAGIMVIDNSTVLPSSLTVGGADSAVNFNGSITRSGTGELSLGKIGTATAAFAGPADVTALNVQAGSLRLTGGLTSPLAMTSVQVAAGGLLQLYDGVGTPMPNLITLNLGAGPSGTATLELEAGDLGSDTMTTSVAAVVANNILFNIRDAGLSPGGTYNLLVAPGGLTAGGATYALGPIGGYTGSTLTVSDTSVVLNVGTAVLGSMYWTGLGLPGPVATTQWNTVDGTGNGMNWASDKAGTTLSTTVPGAGTTVVFQANNAAGGALSTTLEQSFRVNNLVIETSTSTPTSLLIAPGAVASNRLTIQPALATDGIEVKTGATPGVVISAPFTAGAAQTWSVADAVALTSATYATASTTVTVASTAGLAVGMAVAGPGIPVGATVVSITDANNFVISANTTAAGAGTNLNATSFVNLSGGLSGAGNLTKAGAGKVAVSGAGTYTGTAVTVNGGLLEIGSGTVLGGVVATPGAGAAVSIDTGGTFYINSAATTVSNNLTLNGGTLSAAGGNQTYSGTVNLMSGSTIHMLDPNTLNNGRNITIPGVISGTGLLTVNSIGAVSNGNQFTGTLALNGANSGWSGGLLIQRGTVSTNNENGLGTGPITFNPFGRIILQGTNGALWTITQGVTYAAGAIGEINVDNVSGVVSSPFATTFSGPVSLGAASGLRWFLADGANATSELTGGVTLNGDASISVGGGAGAVAIISSVIAESGGSWGLAVNDDLGGWATTNRTLRLTAPNTFTGGLTLGEGVLEFSTVSDVGGPASNLGMGSPITLGTAVLSFIGTTDQFTNRPITTNGSPTLNANGVGGAEIVYSGGITQAANNVLTLTGPGVGRVTGGITQPAGAATADLVVSSGTWTVQDANATIADDLLVTGGTLTLENMVFSLNDDIVVSNAGTVLNLNSTGVWAANNPAGTSSFLFSRGGAVVNINANDVNGIANANAVEGMLAGDGTTAGTGFINMNSFSISVPRLDVGAIADGFDGNVYGTGTITGTSTVTDYSSGFRFFRGSVSANLAGGATILKQGLGTVTVSGDNSGLTGSVAASTRVDSGNLILDYTTHNTTKLPVNRGLDMRGGTVTINGNAIAPTTQAVSGITFASGGANTITMNAGAPGQTATLTLAAITRATSAGTLRLNLGTDTVVTTTTANGTHGLVGASGFATVQDASGTHFATRNVSNQIVALASTVKNDIATWVTGDHVTDDTTGYTGIVPDCLSINSLRFNAAGGSQVAVTPAAFFSIASGGILVTDQVTAGTPGIFGGTLTSGVAELIITQDSSRPFEISSIITSNTGVTKTGNGTMLLSGDNTYTGQTQVQGGILQAAGGNAIGDTSLVTLADDRVNTLHLLASETIGRLQGGSATTGLEALATVAIGGNTLTLNTVGGNVTYAGRFTGNGTIIKEGASNQAFSNISTGFNGAIVVNSGLFQLTGIGQINATAITVNGAGNLLLDNNGTTRSGTRILDSTPVTLNSASGTFAGETRPRGLAIRTNQNATTNETIGSLNFASGNNWLTGEASGTTGIAQVIADNFTRANSATVSVRGRALGQTSGDRNLFRIGTAGNETAWLAAPGNLVGGGGVVGGTATNVSIVPWVVGESLTGGVADANMGNSFVTYVAGRGFVPLSLASEYATYALATATDNVRESLTSDALGLPGTTVNSIVIHNNNTAASVINITATGAGQTLTNTSGAFLFTLNPAADASSAHSINVTGYDAGIAIGTTGEYVINVVNPSSAATTPTLAVTIGSPLTSAASIVKSGRGALILSGVNVAGGGASRTVINEGILEIGDLDNIGGATGDLLLAGGTLRLGAALTDDISTRNIIFQLGGGTIDTNGASLSLAGAVGSGPGAFTKAGLGTLTLNVAGTYAGPTNVNEGVLAIGASNALPVGGPVNIGAGATLDLGTNALSVGLVTTSGASPAIIGSGTLTSSVGLFLNHTGDTTIDTPFAGTGGLLKAQTNVVTLTGASTFTGVIEVQAGALSVATIGNVGAVSGPLGAPANAQTGTIRLGSGTTTGGITYTGAGETTDRLFGLNGSTGGGVITADGTGALIVSSGAHAINGGAKTLTLAGSSAPAIINQIGLVEDCVGVVTLAKAGTNTWEVTVANTYTGATQVDNGVLRIALDNALPVATALRVGTGTTGGTFNLNGFDQTVGSLSVQSTTNAVTNQILIDPGKTLTVNGAVTLGANADASSTAVNALGGGSMVVNSGGANFQVGGATGGTNDNAVTADFTGLASFIANLGTGTFRVGDGNTGTENNASTFKLAANNTITAASIRIGDGSGGSVTHTLTLGTGTNLLNADTVNIGSAGNTIRSGGAVNFDAGDTTGTLTLRASNGTDRATLNIINTTGSTAGNMDSTMNLAGHTADILAGTLTMAARTQNTGSGTATLTFDQGILDVTTLVMASRTGTGTGDATATVNLGDSVAPGSPTTTIGTLNMAVNTSAGGVVTADFNVTGGNVTIGTGAGTAVNMANAAASRTATSTIDLTGGTVTVTGNIVRTGGAGTETATVTLDGATLNMSGNSIGAAGPTVTLAAQSGTLTNLAQLNGGGALTKSTGGVLSMGNGNAYTGGTTVSGGTLLAVNTTGSATGSGALTVDAGATLGGTGAIVAGAGNNIAINGTLDAGLPAAASGTALALTVAGAGQVQFNNTVAFDLFSNLNTGVLNGPTASDQVVINAPDWSNIFFGGASSLVITATSLTPTTFVAGDSWKLFDWVGVVGGTVPVQGTNGFNFISAPTLDAGLFWDYSTLFTAGTVSINAIPEPSRALLLLIGLLGLAARRRRN